MLMTMTDLLTVRHGLRPGDEVRVLKGEKFYAEPGKIVVVAEYPYHFVFKLTASRPQWGTGLYLTRMFSISKQSLWCGDAIVQRVSDGVYVGRGD